MMLALQQEGCHNINIGDPTHHVVPQILSAVQFGGGERSTRSRYL